MVGKKTNIRNIFADSPRKEVIHPQLQLGIPCYDLTLIADLALDGLLPKKGSKNPFSGTADFARLTGGVYKNRERIHRGLLTHDYDQFLLHVGEFQPTIRTENAF